MALQSVIQIFFVTINTCIRAGQTVHFTSIMQALYNWKEGVLVIFLHSDLHTICHHLHTAWTEVLSYPPIRLLIGLVIVLLLPFPPIFLSEYFDQKQQIWKLSVRAQSKWKKLNVAYTTTSFLRTYVLLHVMMRFGCAVWTFWRSQCLENTSNYMPTDMTSHPSWILSNTIVTTSYLVLLFAALFYLSVQKGYNNYVLCPNEQSLPALPLKNVNRCGFQNGVYILE